MIQASQHRSAFHKPNCKSRQQRYQLMVSPSLLLAGELNYYHLQAVVINPMNEDNVLCAMLCSLSQFIFMIPFDSKYSIAAKNTPTITASIFAIFFKAYPIRNPIIPANPTVPEKEGSITMLLISIACFFSSLHQTCLIVIILQLF